jgi:large subunit ribosomal protein L30
MSQLIVTQKKSLISEPESIRKVVRALGLRGVGHVKTHKDNNCIRGMVNKVKHLVSAELKG